MRSTTTLLLGILISLPAAAQQQADAPPPASIAPTTAVTPAPPAATKTATATAKTLSAEPAPVATKGTLLTPTESPLVAAARRANLARKKNASTKAVWKIDDSMVGHTKATAASGTGTATAGMEVAQPPALGDNGKSVQTMASSSSGPSAEERAQKTESLKQEYKKMASETDEVYGGDVSEDQATARATQIPDEINKVNQPQQH